jgi:hypothetical protein
MNAPIQYLKIDLGEKDAFTHAEWKDSLQGATPFRSNVAATGVRGMMQGATGVIDMGGQFYVVRVREVAALVSTSKPSPDKTGS